MHSTGVEIDIMEPLQEQRSQLINQGRRILRTLSMDPAIIYLSETYLTPGLETSHIPYGFKLQLQNFKEYFENLVRQCDRDTLFFLKRDSFTLFFRLEQL